MIISPPFLPAATAGQSDESWIEAAMPAPPSRLADTNASEGSFPLSHNLMWHNGVHIQAPVANGASLPVRAIADGTVVFASAPGAVSTDVNHAQNYNPFDRQGTQTAAWTDNGCVVIEHRTSIGAESTAETEVVFYSLYMHLGALGKITPAGQTARRDLAAGDTIWRKDEVGTPGQVYGDAGQIHFEICCDAVNLQALIGRAPNWVEPAVAPAVPPAPTTDGRTDSIFGSLYFYLPANTPTDPGATQPTSNIRRAVGAAGTTLGTPVWVQMRYARGDCIFQTFDERGATIGAEWAVADAEYDLFEEATARHTALPAATRATSSPSGWYELLRFGRNIGRGTAATDKDPLPPDAAHWRRIVGPAGTALWADLNAVGSLKFSDADFLPVMGWNCIDDDTSPNDQRCDSTNLKNLIRDPDAGNARRMETAELARRLGDAAVRRKLRRTICKFPSEWDRASMPTRYAFIRDLEPFKTSPQAWPRLEAHLRAVSFDALPAAYLAADWRIHPQEFFGLLRKCGWLSTRELAQCIPRKVVEQTKNLGNQTVYPRSPISWEEAVRRSQRFSPELSRTLRKYLISESMQRTSFFFANAIQETIYLSRTSELGGPTLRYAPWYGRGILQLTWEDNYVRYGDFKGWARSGAATNRNEVEADIQTACDSGGFYWVSGAKPIQSLICINEEADSTPILTETQLTNVCDNYNYRSKQCATSMTSIAHFDCPQLERVARAVNTGNANSTGTVNGLVPRSFVFAYALAVTTEFDISFMALHPQRPQ